MIWGRTLAFVIGGFGFAKLLSGDTFTVTTADVPVGLVPIKFPSMLLPLELASIALLPKRLMTRPRTLQLSPVITSPLALDPALLPSSSIFRIALSPSASVFTLAPG